MTEEQIDLYAHNIISKIGLGNAFNSLIQFCDKDILTNWLTYMNKTINECENILKTENEKA